MLKRAIFDFEGIFFYFMFSWDTAVGVYPQFIGIESMEDCLRFITASFKRQIVVITLCRCIKRY